MARIFTAVYGGMDDVARNEGLELEEADRIIGTRLGFPP